MKTIKHCTPFVKAAKLFGIPEKDFFALREIELIKIYDMKINDEIELIVNFNNMLEDVLPRNKNIVMMLNNSDPTIKETNYKLITTAGEIYKYLLKANDEKGNIYYGINIRKIKVN